jgi:hypothetical protein
LALRDEGGLGKYPPRIGRAEEDVGIEENVPSRPGGERGENGRLGRYEYADDVSGRFRYE